MRYTQSEKYEIIQIVEGSTIGVNKTLIELGIHKRTFYNWYERYFAGGFDALVPQRQKGIEHRIWNKIPYEEKNEVVQLALEKPELSSRELACYITDNYKHCISESSVYRILKQRGFIAAPAFMLRSTSYSFKDKTVRVNQMYQTDFTYFKIIGWGWYYLSTVLDDYSRYIIAWDLCSTMSSPDVKQTIDKALYLPGLNKKNAPKLLSNNGLCHISAKINEFLNDKETIPVHGRPCHSQTQGKIERYLHSLKNVIKLNHYYCIEELIIAFQKNYLLFNHKRSHESLNILTPASVFFCYEYKIQKLRGKIKKQPIRIRRKNCQKGKLMSIN